MTQTSNVQGPLRSEMTDMRMRIYAFLASADSHEQLHNPSLRLLSDAMAHLDRLRALAPVVHPGAPPGEFVRDGRYGAVGHVDYRLAGSSGIQWYADCPEPGTQLYIAPPARPGAAAPAEAEMFRDLVAAAERAGHTLINKEDNWFALLHRIVWTRMVPAHACTEPVAWQDVRAERHRQISVEGWHPEHDDEHEFGELAAAAVCYARHAGNFDPDGPRPMYRLDDDQEVPDGWPWDTDCWKPKDRRRDLVRAGALILAEIERLDRASGSTTIAPPYGEANAAQSR